MVDETTKDKPPIFVVGGIANDLESIGNFVTEIAVNGREVIAVAYPDSYNGSVTPEFAQAVVSAEHYEPHAAFFKAAIDHHFLPDGERELWGYSTGAPIVAEILNDPKQQETTSRAVFVCPASTTTQSEGAVKRGVMSDIAFIKEKGTLPNLTLTTGLKEGDEEKPHRQSRKTSFEGLLSHVARSDDAWSTAKVKEGGEIVFVSCENDKVTRSWDNNDRFGEHPQGRVIPIEGGYHATPIVQPERVMPQILAPAK